MNSSLYIGASGMKGLAEGMQVTTNNIANVSTIGFKQQNILFADIYYQTQASMGNWWNAQDDSRVAIGQVGMGLAIDAVRTSYTQGALESTNSITDLAINGKGFFQVTDGTNTFYTRAGDFVQDKDGVWRTPTGLALNGFPLDAQGNTGELSPVKVDPTMTLAAKATTNVELALNVNSSENITTDAENPYFSLLKAYDASLSTPLASGSYGSSQAINVYDADGTRHTLTAYFDAAPSSTGGNRYTEFLLANEVSPYYDSDGNLITPEAGEGLLMSGVLEFDSAGNLLNVSAFTPSVAGSTDLADWTPASLIDGNPAFSFNGSDIGMNFGVSAGNGWANAPANAAEVGADWNALPSMADITNSAWPTTSFAATTLNNSYKQDGYSEGYLSNISVSTNGVISGTFSNGQVQDLWEIPVCRFTSEDGLRREGGNLFSATEDSGQMEMGRAGTENYGTINAYNIENSNVDLANEMVNMIINQRGFQSNSKVVTTADAMLQKAMELKR